MDFEQQLKRVADIYTAQGYQVVIRPGPEDLPPFAKDFKVELLGRRGGGGVLVTVKKNREEMAADTELPRYAEVTGGQTGWRFDLFILEAENAMAREVRGAQEPSEASITHNLDVAEVLARGGYVNPAVMAAWAVLEAAMRRRLRAEGETVGWGIQPQEMLNELYSTGILTAEEFPRLENAYRLRNHIAHGFAAPNSDAGVVQFLTDTARRLLAEPQTAEQTA